MNDCVRQLRKGTIMNNHAVVSERTEGLLHEYYHGAFEEDVDRFLDSIKIPPYVHTDRRHLVFLGFHQDCLRVLNEARRAFFVACMFRNILADQLVFAHLQFQYDEFESLTRYPKNSGILNEALCQIRPWFMLSEAMRNSRIQADQLLSLAGPAARLLINEFRDFKANQMPDLFLNTLLKSSYDDLDIRTPLRGFRRERWSEIELQVMERYASALVSEIEQYLRNSAPWLLAADSGA